MPDAILDISSREETTRAQSSADTTLDEVRRLTSSTRSARLRDIWMTLPVAGVLAVRNFKSMYKQTLFGPIWLLAQPLGILLAFTVIFDGVTKVDSEGVPYQLFALVGISAWTFTSASLSAGPRVFIRASGLITLLNSARAVFATAATLMLLPNLIAPLLLTIAGIFLLGYHLTLNVLVLPIAVLWLMAILYFLTLMLGSLNVWTRDVASVMPFFLQGGIFLTPVGYSLDSAPPSLHTFLSLNPLTGIIEVWRWCLLDIPLDASLVAISLAWTLAISIPSWLIFKRLEPRFADVI